MSPLEIFFIGHSGLCVRFKRTEILIDPWLTSSSFSEPILESIGGGHRTIDYLIPEIRSQHTDFKPDAVLVSHFHTHHSNKSDIQKLLLNSSAEFGGPQVGTAQTNAIKKNLGEKINYWFCRGGEKKKIGSLEVTALSHTSMRHLAWHISCEAGSLLHLTDTHINQNVNDRRPDPIWQTYRELPIDFLFIGSGGHSSRAKFQETKHIIEHISLSPIESAKITALLKPKAVGVIGIYNFSIYKNRREFILPAELVEQQFGWALDYLEPKTQFVPLRPGMRFQVSSGQIQHLISAN